MKKKSVDETGVDAARRLAGITERYKDLAVARRRLHEGGSAEDDSIFALFAQAVNLSAGYYAKEQAISKKAVGAVRVLQEELRAMNKLIDEHQSDAEEIRSKLISYLDQNDGSPMYDDVQNAASMLAEIDNKEVWLHEIEIREKLGSLLRSLATELEGNLSSKYPNTVLPRLKTSLSKAQK